MFLILVTHYPHGNDVTSKMFSKKKCQNMKRNKVLVSPTDTELNSKIFTHWRRVLSS